METRRLEMFVTLVDSENFRLAADRLFVTQPALSQQIIKLETELGFQLIDRSTRPFTVTPAGREFYVRCQTVLDHMRGIDDLMRSTQEGLLGRVRVGLAVSLMYGHIPPVLRGFRRAHDKIDLQIVYGTTAQILEDVQSGRLDVCILLTAPRQLECRTLYREPYVIALPDDHPLAGQAQVRVDEVRGESIISVPRHAAPENHDALVMACMQAGFSPRGIEAVGSYMDHIGLVSAGAGISFVPRSMTQFQMSNVVYRDLIAPTVDAVVSVCWVSDRVDATAKRFIRHIAHAYDSGDLPDDGTWGHGEPSASAATTRTQSTRTTSTRSKQEESP